jgi:hypothetical protein
VDGLGKENLVYIIAIWCISGPFGICRYLIGIWYILCLFGTLFPVLVFCPKKNLATLLLTSRFQVRETMAAFSRAESLVQQLFLHPLWRSRLHFSQTEIEMVGRSVQKDVTKRRRTVDGHNIWRDKSSHAK